MQAQLKTVALVSFVLLVTSASCVPVAAPTPAATGFPTGAFVAGDWIWELRADGTEIAIEHGTVYEDGSYTVNGSQVVFQDTKNAFCGPQPKGIYNWAFDGQALTFKAIDDACVGRRDAVEASTWTRKTNPVQAAGAFPTGSFQAIDNAIGRFTVNFRPDGKYAASLVGQTEWSGSYTLNENQIVIDGGPCTGPDKETGTYTWKYDGKMLTFYAVKELCHDRWRALNLVWSKD